MEKREVIHECNGYLTEYSLERRKFPDYDVFCIGDGCTGIRKDAFSRMTHIGSLQIPYGCTDIEPGAFSKCKIDSFLVHSGNKSYKYSKGFLLSYDGTELVAVAAGAFSYYQQVVPAEVRKILPYAFSSCDSYFSLPEELKRIEHHAFQGFEGTSVDIPEKVEWVGEEAFKDTPELRSILIESPDTRLGEKAIWREQPEYGESHSDFSLEVLVPGHHLDGIDFGTGVTLTPYQKADKKELERMGMPEGPLSEEDIRFRDFFRKEVAKRLPAKEKKLTEEEVVEKYHKITQEIAPLIHEYIRENGMPKVWPLYYADKEKLHSYHQFPLSYIYPYAYHMYLFSGLVIAGNDAVSQIVTTPKPWEPEFRDDYDLTYKIQCEKLEEMQEKISISELLKRSGPEPEEETKAKKTARRIFEPVGNLLGRLAVGLGMLLITLLITAGVAAVALLVMLILHKAAGLLDYDSAKKVMLIIAGLGGLAGVILFIYSVTAGYNSTEEKPKKKEKKQTEPSEKPKSLRLSDEEQRKLEEKMEEILLSDGYAEAKARNEKKNNEEKMLAHMWQETYHNYIVNAGSDFIK